MTIKELCSSMIKLTFNGVVIERMKAMQLYTREIIEWMNSVSCLVIHYDHLLEVFILHCIASHINIQGYHITGSSQRLFES